MKASLVGAGILLVGSGAFARPVGASMHNVNVDVTATINRGQRGVIPVSVTSMDGTSIQDFLDAQGVAVEDLRFGPRASHVPESGTAPRSYSFKKRGTVLGIRFDSGAGSEDYNWWDDDEYRDRTSAAVAATRPSPSDTPAVFGEDTSIKVVGK